MFIYFYNYRATLEDGSVMTGHGVVELPYSIDGEALEYLTSECKERIETDMNVNVKYIYFPLLNLLHEAE